MEGGNPLEFYLLKKEAHIEIDFALEIALEKLG